MRNVSAARSAIGARARRFVGERRGHVTIEFAIIFPALMWFVLTIFEIGFIGVRMVMLDHGLDMAARELRLGVDPTADHEKFKKRVCNFTAILSNCERDLVLEVVELDINSAYPQNAPNCIDRTGDIDPTISFNAGGRNRIMFVRACMVIDPIFPGLGITLGLTKDSSGGLQIVSYSAFMNEPR